MMKKQHSSGDTEVFGGDSRTERHSNGCSFVLVGAGGFTGFFPVTALTF